MRNQRSEVRGQNFQTLEVCARWVSSHWKAATACALLLAFLSCSHKEPVAPGNASAEARLAELYPRLSPLFYDQPVSKEQFVSEMMRDMRGIKDQELEFKIAEAEIAAWSRFEPSHTMTKEQRTLLLLLLTGHEDEVKTLEQFPVEKRSNVTTNDAVEIHRLLNEEGAKLGLRRDATGRLEWNR